MSRYLNSLSQKAARYDSRCGKCPNCAAVAKAQVDFRAMREELRKRLNDLTTEELEFIRLTKCDNPR